MSGRPTGVIAVDLRRGSPHSIVAHEAADRLLELLVEIGRLQDQLDAAYHQLARLQLRTGQR